jgi:hypothetical protein
MKLYFHIELEQIDFLNKIIKNPFVEFEKIKLFKSRVSENLILVSLEYDTYIRLLDQNKIEIV